MLVVIILLIGFENFKLSILSLRDLIFYSYGVKISLEDEILKLSCFSDNFYVLFKSIKFEVIIYFFVQVENISNELGIIEGIGNCIIKEKGKMFFFSSSKYIFKRKYQELVFEVVVSIFYKIFFKFYLDDKEI